MAKHAVYQFGGATLDRASCFSSRTSASRSHGAGQRPRAASVRGRATANLLDRAIHLGERGHSRRLRATSKKAREWRRVVRSCPGADAMVKFATSEVTGADVRPSKSRSAIFPSHRPMLSEVMRPWPGTRPRRERRRTGLRFGISTRPGHAGWQTTARITRSERSADEDPRRCVARSGRVERNR